MARPGGFEPLTLCFGGTRSIHLSYGRCERSILTRGLGRSKANRIQRRDFCEPPACSQNVEFRMV